MIEESKFAPVTYPLDILVMSYHDRWPATEIGRVTVTDKDQYDSFEYTIVPPAPDGLFDVDHRTGVVATVTSVDAGHYIVNVSVSDGKFTSYATVTVTIRPIWDDILKHSISIRYNKSVTRLNLIFNIFKTYFNFMILLKYYSFLFQYPLLCKM